MDKGFVERAIVVSQDELIVPHEHCWGGMGWVVLPWEGKKEVVPLVDALILQ